MSSPWRFLLLCALAAQVATCGQKGPLHLPGQPGKGQPAAVIAPWLPLAAGAAAALVVAR